MKITFAQRQDSYEKKYVGTIIGGNIKTDDANRFPECSDEYVAFTWHYSPTYHDESNGKVNTHFDFPYGGKYRNNGSEGIYRIYAKLNFIERQRLYFITRRSWFHNHPVATWALIINTFFALANFYFAFQNHKTSLNNVESEYLNTLQKQSEIQQQQNEIIKSLTESKTTELDTSSVN